MIDNTSPVGINNLDWLVWLPDNNDIVHACEMLGRRVSAPKTGILIFFYKMAPHSVLKLGLNNKLSNDPEKIEINLILDMQVKIHVSIYTLMTNF